MLFHKTSFIRSMLAKECFGARSSPAGAWHSGGNVIGRNMLIGALHDFENYSQKGNQE
jgi:hypothetical protein